MPADIYALQLTPTGTGAIAVILLTSEDPALATQLLEKISPHKYLAAVHVGTAKRTNLRDADGNPLDDALLVRTAANTWELHLHGGIAVVNATLETLQFLGVKTLTLQEAAERGILGDPLGAELQLALPQAMTATAARLVLDQSAALAQWAGHWKGQLQFAAPQTLWQFHSAAQWLLTRSVSLEHLLTPPRIAIIGPPNAGKSTLANALLGRTVAITSNIAGTTRDWVDAQALFTATATAGDPTQAAVTLVDTAGIRETTDLLESQSIERTHQQAAAADAIIVIFDASREPAPEELLLAQPRRHVPVIVAANKMDIVSRLPPSLTSLNPVAISAQSSAGIEALMHRTLRSLDLADIDPNTPFAFSPRLKSLFTQLFLTPTPTAALQLLARLP